MASTVTVFTAARSQAIEDEAIISGAVNGSGHLILTKHNGGVVDAGAVKGADSTVPGPTGPQGATGPAGSVTWDSMPQNLVICVTYTGTAPARPTSRSDVVVRWRGPSAPSGALNGDEYVSTA
jgi:hypothetical protein